MMRMSVDLVGREKCFEGFFGVKRFSKNFEEASPTVSFLSQKQQSEHLLHKIFPCRPCKNAKNKPTPLKTNMSPENQWLEDVFPTEILLFLGDMLVFRGVSLSPTKKPPHMKNSALEVAKLASLSKSYKEPKGR